MVKASEPFECDIKAIDWSPDGNFLVVGGEAGNLFSVNAESFEIISKVQSKMSQKNNKCWIQDLKINPSGQSVVFGTHGGLSKVEVCSLKPDGSLVYLKTFDLGLSSALLHIDWTEDGKSVVLNS